MTVTRGTTNSNDRGSSYSRRRRREWLVETYRANEDVCPDQAACSSWPFDSEHTHPAGDGEPACRCYRCGVLLTVDTVSVDRIIPGCMGGTYRRDNIRPACLTCNSSTGGALSRRKAS